MNHKQLRRWVECACDCGKAGIVLRLDRLRQTKSCGCFQRERATKHGRWNHPLYPVWRGMMDRCQNPENKRFQHYGARGISVCERWLDINAFVADMEPTYRPGLELDRINVDAGYSPENCRWVDRATQARNKTNNINVTMNGETKTLAEWAAAAGLTYGTVWERVKVLGWEPTRAITTPAIGADERCRRARAARRISLRPKP